MANKDPVFHNLFMTMCPTYTFIDRANAQFNRGMGFMREYIALISHAWEIDTIYDHYLTDKDPSNTTAEEFVSKYGLSPDDEDSIAIYKETLQRLVGVDDDNTFKKRMHGPIAEGSYWNALDE